MSQTTPAPKLGARRSIASVAALALLVHDLARDEACVEQGQGSNPLNSWRFHDACQTSAVAGIGGISILDLIGQRPKIRGRGD